MTIVYLVNEILGKVHMAEKLRGIGKGYNVGYGGKIETGETADMCIIRETGKESIDIVIDPADLEPLVLIDFLNGPDVPFDDASCRVLFYRVRKWTGTGRRSDEMGKLKPFSIKRVMNNECNIIPGDDHVLKYLFSGECAKGWVRRTSDLSEVLGSNIVPCTKEDLII